MPRIGLPAALQMLSMALAEIVLLGLVNRHGSTATAACGAAAQVLNRVQFPAMSLAMRVLHGLYHCHKEKKDGLFRQPGVALGAAGGRAPGA